jgi:hypothetical protein
MLIRPVVIVLLLVLAAGCGAAARDAGGRQPAALPWPASPCPISPHQAP